MKYILWIAITVFIFFSIGCSEDNPNEPDTDLKIMIDPAEQSINVQNEADFNIKIENVSNLFAISIEITFDENLISVPENTVSVGDFWDSITISEYIIEPGCLNICIGLIQSSTADGVSGNGSLFSFKLKGDNAGVSEITLQNLQLIDENGSQISNFDGIIISNGSLVINE